MLRNKLIVTNIQRMCFHDGPGIRTTVFFKGCNLHCPWCSNPENIRFECERYEQYGKWGIYGTEYSPEALVREISKDKAFWGEKGGVTLSGGEALQQKKNLMPFLSILKRRRIHIAVETSLFVSEKLLKETIPYIDCFIVDVKILESQQCQKILGGDLDLYLRNVDFVYKNKKLSVFRLPLCDTFTFTEDNRKRQITFLKQYPDIPVQIFSIHGLGESKYRSLGRIMPSLRGVEEDRLMEYNNILLENRIHSEVIRI